MPEFLMVIITALQTPSHIAEQRGLTVPQMIKEDVMFQINKIHIPSREELISKFESNFQNKCQGD
jgi:hypothetical protein